jgi:hypothetical protein
MLGLNLNGQLTLIVLDSLKGAAQATEAIVLELPVGGPIAPLEEKIMSEDLKTRLLMLVAQMKMELTKEKESDATFLMQLDRFQHALDNSELDYGVVQETLRAFPRSLLTRAAAPASDGATARELWVLINKIVRARPVSRPRGESAPVSSRSNR